MSHDRLSIHPGELTYVEVGFSEVACHLGIAGKRMLVQLLPGPHHMAQVYSAENVKLSFPITYGEAGIYRDAAGFYHY